jgi:hypothetical protein
LMREPCCRNDLPWLAAVLLALPCSWWGAASAFPAEATRPAAAVEPSAARLYDPDACHPWNRLHGLLWTRITQDGRIYDQESLEPLFVPESRFLTSRPFHQQAINLLDEFLRTRAEERIKDPLKRAILQRDLWAVFTTTIGEARQAVRVDERGQVFSVDRFEDPGDAVPAQRTVRRRFQKRLVQVMRRIALKPAEIEGLPANLTQAVNAGMYPRTFNPADRYRAFLPADLLAQDGPWMAVTTPTRLDNGLVAAPQHLRFTKGRSIFLVLLRLPQGRQATEGYLKRLAEGELLQFPKGTQTALLRRMLLIDSAGELRASPLTESVQLRVFQQMDTGLPFEFTLSRGELFVGRHGGLRAIGADETSYFDFQTRVGDAFEAPQLRAAEPILKTCTRCHTRLDDRGGIHTVQTIYARVVNQTRPALVPTDPTHEVQTTMDWTRMSYTWGLLQGLWESADRE